LASSPLSPFTNFGAVKHEKAVSCGWGHSRLKMKPVVLTF
jgi:hypothetical protein